MNKACAIQHIYPEAKILEDFTVLESKGVVTVEWNYSQPEPTPEQLDVAWIEVQAKKAQDKINKESQDYLDSTDWYVIRNQETGSIIPPEILTLRQESRLKIV